MKANELMLGDLVNLSPGKANIPNYVMIHAIKYDNYVSKDYVFDIVFLSTGLVQYNYSIRSLKPIPLTPEILEKNFQEFLPGFNLMYQLKGPYCAMNEDGQWVFGLVKIDGEKSARYPLVKISFVHQLQHALRLCGIEKEITL